MNEFLKIIQERHSARVAFDPNHQIAKQDLEQILEAARWAPTAHNMQNFEIVVVDDKKQLEAIGKIRSQVSETFLRENYQQMSFSEQELLTKNAAVTAMLDRLLHHGHVLKCGPRSWRTKTDLPEQEKLA